MDGVYWKTLLKWKIWGYHYFRKHPYKGGFTYNGRFMNFSIREAEPIFLGSWTQGMSSSHVCRCLMISRLETSRKFQCNNASSYQMKTWIPSTRTSWTRRIRTYSEPERQKHAQNAMDSLEVPQVFVGFVGRFFPLVRWKKGCVFFTKDFCYGWWIEF